ncbi:MAG TPA: hypothetical protein VD862_04795 [Candidatus Paceibacterota bacterium]|nr:hypothetical protein [Candidatus Paceibacterota bacterium]
MTLDEHPLKNDPVFRACIEAALKSPCQKLRFGAALVYEDGFTLRVSRTECNRPVEGLEEWCTPQCIRFSIPSRTESMVGACGHAEERLLWSALRRGDLSPTDHLYVTGVDVDGNPGVRKLPEFTCIRCAVAIAYSGVASVNFVYDGRWVRRTPAQALASARQYASGTKKV